MRSPRAIVTTLLLTAVAGTLALSIHFDPAAAAKELPVSAWVKIIEATAAKGGGGQDCGMRYSARVVKAIKGTSESQSIAFGYFRGRAIGAEFIVFLQHKPAPDGNRTSVSSILSIPACLEVLPELVEVAEGVGTLPVSRDALGSAMVRLDSVYHQIPLDLVSSDKRRGRVIGGQYVGDLEVGASVFADFIQKQAAER